MAAITSDDKLIEAENLCTELYRIRDTFFPPVVGEKEKRQDKLLIEVDFRTKMLFLVILSVLARACAP